MYDVIPGHRGNRHPFEVWVLCAFAVGGAGVLLGPDPSSLDALVPPLVRMVWAILLLYSSLLGLLSSVWRDDATSWLLERAALGPIGFASFAYAVAIAKVAGPGGLVPALLIVGIGIASLRRRWEAGRSLRNLELLAPRNGEGDKDAPGS